MDELLQEHDTYWKEYQKKVWNLIDRYGKILCELPKNDLEYALKQIFRRIHKEDIIVVKKDRIEVLAKPGKIKYYLNLLTHLLPDFHVKFGKIEYTPNGHYYTFFLNYDI